MINTEVQAKLLTISRSTIERILRTERKARKAKGSCSTKPGTLLRNQIPIKVFWPWDDQKPGFTEIDTVSHDGGNASGEFCSTLTVTDICDQWTVNIALKNKAQRWVKEAMDNTRLYFPVPLKGIDSDNGSEFINKTLQAWCEKYHINFTRSRSYHKNDNCYVEQKNDDRVRKTVGYGRISGEKAYNALVLVYKYLNPLGNFFYPCKKLISKQRVNSKTKKVYDKPITPFQRIMERDDVSPEDKQKLANEKSCYNIVQLQDALDSAVDKLLKIIYSNAIKESHG
jgi:hypothetical protein